VRRNGVRVDLVGEPFADGGAERFLNLAAFREAPAGRFGNLERNSLRSPATYQLNLGLTKNFEITEDVKIQFRAEAFNVFNNPQLSGPNTDIGNTDPRFGFGTIRGTQFASNRQVQLGLRLEF
jgi:hypothetical protein